MQIFEFIMSKFPKNGYLLHFVLAMVVGFLAAIANKDELGYGLIIGLAAGKETGDIVRNKYSNIENVLDFFFTIAGGILGVFLGGVVSGWYGS